MSETTTLTLSEFLKARYADEYELAAGVSFAGVGGWLNPDRVLEDIMAKRAIVDWCSERHHVYVGRLGDDPSDPKNYVDGELKHPTDSVVLRLLAAPYRKHPDFREEWS